MNTIETGSGLDITSEHVSSSQLRATHSRALEFGLSQYSTRSMEGPSKFQLRERAIADLASVLGLSEDTLRAHDQLGHNIIDWLIINDRKDLAIKFSLQPDKFTSDHSDLIAQSETWFQAWDKRHPSNVIDKAEKTWKALLARIPGKNK